MELIEIDYKGIKVDECSKCEGVWLDAGELEAISRFEKTSLDKLFSVFSELPRSKLRGIKFSKKLSSPLMGED